MTGHASRDNGLRDETTCPAKKKRKKSWHHPRQQGWRMKRNLNTKRGKKGREDIVPSREAGGKGMCRKRRP